MVGTDTLNISVADAMVAFNTGNLGRSKILEKLRASAGGNWVMEFEYLDKHCQRKSIYGWYSLC